MHESWQYILYSKVNTTSEKKKKKFKNDNMANTCQCFQIWRQKNQNKPTLSTLVNILSCFPSPNQTNSLSIAICTDWIWGFSCEPSFIVTDVAITGRDTPHARPKACLERTNTYGTFLSSHNSGKWRMISSGSASAAITMNSEIPRLRVLVAKRKKKWKQNESVHVAYHSS